MSIKKLLLKKTPVKVHEEPYFAALLGHIKKQDIQNTEQLNYFLKEEIDIAEQWLKDNNMMGAKLIRNHTLHLDMLKKSQNLTKYL